MEVILSSSRYGVFIEEHNNSGWEGVKVFRVVYGECVKVFNSFDTALEEFNQCIKHANECWKLGILGDIKP